MIDVFGVELVTISLQESNLYKSYSGSCFCIVIIYVGMHDTVFIFCRSWWFWTIPGKVSGFPTCIALPTLGFLVVSKLGK